MQDWTACSVLFFSQNGRKKDSGILKTVIGKSNWWRVAIVEPLYVSFSLKRMLVSKLKEQKFLDRGTAAVSHRCVDAVAAAAAVMQLCSLHSYAFWRQKNFLFFWNFSARLPVAHPNLMRFNERPAHLRLHHTFLDFKGRTCVMCCNWIGRFWCHFTTFVYDM